MRRETRMARREELPDKIFRDRVPFDETGHQPLAEQLHDHITVPCLERVKGAVVRERTVGQEDVQPDAGAVTASELAGAPAGWFRRRG
jgi:hypothetical protein